MLIGLTRTRVHIISVPYCEKAHIDEIKLTFYDQLSLRLYERYPVASDSIGPGSISDRISFLIDIFLELKEKILSWTGT